ncbi:hypothetical protein GN956_G2744 [Arapaima gigas]
MVHTLCSPQKQPDLLANHAQRFMVRFMAKYSRGAEVFGSEAVEPAFQKTLVSSFSCSNSQYLTFKKDLDLLPQAALTGFLSTVNSEAEPLVPSVTKSRAFEPLMRDS